MVRMIRITAGPVVVEAELRATPTAEAIEKALPFTARVDRWGGEIYFEIPVTAELEPDSREVLLPGELGYWPEGRCFCIFLGPTPTSEGDEIRPASAVNVFGHLKGSWDALKNVAAGAEIRVEAAGAASGPAESTEPQEQPDHEAAETRPEPDEQPTPPPEPQLESEQEPTEPPIPPAADGQTDQEAEPPGEPTPYIPVPIEPEIGGTDLPLGEHDFVPAAVGAVPEISEPIEPPGSSAEGDSGAGPATGPTAAGPSPWKEKQFEMTRQTLWLCVGAGVVIAVVAFALGLAARRGDGRLGPLRDDVANQADAIEQLQQTVAGLEKTVQTQGTQIDSLRQADTRLDKKITAVEGRVGPIAQQVAAAERRLVAMDKQIQQAASADLKWTRDPSSGHSYAVSPYALPWHAAEAYARRVGAHLVTITSEQENAFLVTTFGETTEYWIGLTDEKEEGKWAWVTGEPFEYANWAPGEPDNYRKKQHFVIINDTKPDRGHLEPGKWNDIVGNEAHLAILEKDR